MLPPLSIYLHWHCCYLWPKLRHRCVVSFSALTKLFYKSFTQWIHTVSLQIFRSFLGSFDTLGKIIYFFHEITTFISRLLSFNNFFSDIIWKTQFFPRSWANPEEVSTDSNSLSKILDIILNMYTSTYCGAINWRFFKHDARKKSLNEKSLEMNVAISQKKLLVHFKVTENESERKTCKLCLGSCSFWVWEKYARVKFAWVESRIIRCLLFSQCWF